ncbi:MAG: ATP-binding protein [Acidobacteria bacterium]|nr:ATP-binding protein [Acidobacteriota bacterium]MCW5949987.1 ATP-binding protein [Pyrinomonadaceae bacterium]
MQRNILIIDDHDDLASALSEVFSYAGHIIEVAKDRDSGLRVDNIERFDLVITDLDVDGSSVSDRPEPAPNVCLPSAVGDPLAGEHVKAFKICAANYRRDDFDEGELRDLVATVLDYKIRFVDTIEAVAEMHESIEFELPSAISTMHVVLDYLMKRVEKLGVIKPEQSNLFVALDEAFVNAVKHGNKFDSTKLVRIAAEISKKEARFTVEDEGEGFDVNKIPDPLDPENLFKASGRGVLFIYNIMDEVIYNDRGNRLTMVKKASDEPAEDA